MKTKKIKTTVCFMVFVLGLIYGGHVFSQDDPLSDLKAPDASLEDEMAWLRAETYVITASRVLENIKKSAASITVITDRQIRQMGARHLADVLRTVPGIGVMYGPDGTYKIDARGILKGGGQHVLLMINSHPVNENFGGGAMPLYDTSVVNTIQRIEVIRGPGSALYGANAFAGVINIITKEAAAVDGIQVSALGGSFQTQQYDLLAGKQFGDLGIVFNFNYLDTDGYAAYIEEDSVTTLDQLVGTRASLAPGHTSNDDQKYDTSLALEYKGLKFEGRYLQRTKKWPVSIGNALSERHDDEYKSYYLTLGYEREITEEFSLSGKVYRNHISFDADYQAFPPGTPFPTPDGITLFQDGVIGQLSRKENRTGLEMLATYTLSESNTMVAGMTYEKMEQNDVEYSANFLYTPIQNVLIPLPGVQNITDIQNYNKDVDRTFKALFLEDLWDIWETLRLTVGARYDNYSDFGDSFNPRAGITWEFIDGYDVKLLYGRAFRAPSFNELYSQNNPAVVGNPDLDPEIVDTYEVSVGAEFTEALSGRVTGFLNDIKDSLNLVPVEGQQVYQNKDQIRSQGIELEAKYDFGKGTYLGANYTYQDVKNRDTDERYLYAPEHKGNLLANVRLSKYFNLYTNLYFQGKYARPEGDDRKDLSGFGIVNVTLLARNFFKGLEVRGSVYNLLDESYAYIQTQDTLPGDFPQPGRNFMVELRYEF